MEDRGSVQFYRSAVEVLRGVAWERLWLDSSLRNGMLVVLTVITCSYSLIGFLGSLVLLISFLSGFAVFDKVFNVYKFTVPDLTTILLHSWNSSKEAPEAQHTRKRLIRQNTSDPGCRVCADVNCEKEMNPSHNTNPWEELTIPANINQALETLLIQLLEKYINPWYKQCIPEDLAFQTNFLIELRVTIRHAASILIHRVQKVNLADFILYRILPVCSRHISIVENSTHTKVKWHVALTNRNVEVDYLRCVAKQVLPVVLPSSCTNSKILFLLNREILAGWILLPIFDAAADPTVLNSLLFYLLSSGTKKGEVAPNKVDETPTKSGKKVVSPLHDDEVDRANPSRNEEFNETDSTYGGNKNRDKRTEERKSEEKKNKSEPDERQNFGDTNSEDPLCQSSGAKKAAESANVKFLETFIPDIESIRDQWHPTLEDILKDQSLQFAFMQYLKTQSDTHVLQFCLDVEEFNSKMLSPDLTSEDLDILYKDAWDLYSIYFSAHSPDCIEFDPKLGQELRKILSKDVSKLRTSTPLFKAYEFAYNKLEDEHVGNFQKSAEFYSFLYGPKMSSSSSRTSGFNSPESVESPVKTKKSPEGPLDRLSSRLQRVTGVLKPNVVLEGQKDFFGSPVHEDEIEIAEPVRETEVIRDLSKWKVSVFNSRLKSNPNFTVKVVRTDLPASDPQGEWSVLRKISDFYTLESKLTEFHGNFSDAQLPPKKLLQPCSEDSRVYESFVRSLLAKPELQGSELLCEFLTLETFEVEEFNLGKLFKKSVPGISGISLKRERGQHLDNFIRTFMESIKTKSTKMEWKDVGEETKPRHVVDFRSKVFGNNLDLPPREESISKVELQFDTSSTTQVYDGPAKCLLFIAVKSFKFPGPLLRFLFTIITVLKASLDSLIHVVVTKLLNQALAPNNLAYLVYLLDWSLLKNKSKTDPVEMKQSAELSIESCSALFRPVYRKIFSTLQDPLLNKQLFYQILEEILAEIFPELLHLDSPSEPSSRVDDT